MGKSLVEMAAELVSTQINTTEMNTDEISQALNNTFQTLKNLQDAEVSGQQVGESQAGPVMDPAKSIQKNKIVCLECGESFKMLSPKHLRSHDLTLKEYRAKYGFTARQPLCARALSEKRSKSGKKRGLPENLRKSIAARSGKKKK
ncbi:MAG: MucR family transcriptional regulator [Desulfobulbaceae bacterium]|nr:MucR family transcriptional regulator [Desulfobulbaceae bacterium]